MSNQSKSGSLCNLIIILFLLFFKFINWIQAAILAIQAAGGDESIEILTDSRYVINGTHGYFNIFCFFLIFFVQL